MSPPPPNGRTFNYLPWRMYCAGCGDFQSLDVDELLCLQCWSRKHGFLADDGPITCLAVHVGPSVGQVSR